MPTFSNYSFLQRLYDQIKEEILNFLWRIGSHKWLCRRNTFFSCKDWPNLYNLSKKCIVLTFLKCERVEEVILAKASWSKQVQWQKTSDNLNMGTMASDLHTKTSDGSITTPMADTSSQMPTLLILIAPIARGNVELPNNGANDTVQLLVFFLWIFL